MFHKVYVDVRVLIIELILLGIFLVMHDLTSSSNNRRFIIAISFRDL